MAIGLLQVKINIDLDLCLRFISHHIAQVGLFGAGTLSVGLNDRPM